MTPQEFVQHASQFTATQKRSIAQLLLEQVKIDAQLKTSSALPATAPRPDMDRLQERQWLAENWAAYLDQWVCLEGDQLISHGIDGHQVRAQAKAAGIVIPFIVRVTDPVHPQMGGW
jgi:hypothetical protein